MGSTFAILGRNFATDIADLEIRVGQGSGPAQAVTEDGTRITAIVPAGATTGKVVVVSDGVFVEGPEFTVDEVAPAPHLTSVEPTTIELGESPVVLRLFGSGFVPASRVLLDGESIGSGTTTATSITITLPVGLPETLGVRTLQVVNDPPGGGSSETIQVYFYKDFRLLWALATGPRTVLIGFGEALNPSLVGQKERYLVLPHRTIVEAALVPDSDRVVSLTVGADLEAGVEYTVISTLETEFGGSLESGWDRDRFQGYGTPLSARRETGVTGCGDGQLADPVGIHVDEEFTSVVERGGHQVQLYDFAGAAAFGYLGYDGTSAGHHVGTGTASGCPGETGSAEPGAFNAPRGAVVVGADGSRYVSDTGNDRILRYAESLAYGGTVGGSWSSPVLLGTRGENLLVAEANGTIVEVDTTGAVVSRFGQEGRSAGQFGFAIGTGGLPAAVARGEDLYVLEPGNARVQLLRDGTSIGWLGDGRTTGTWPPEGECCTTGTDPGSFTRPSGLVLDPAGRLWVADEASGGRLQVFDHDGRFLAEHLLGYVPGGIFLGPRAVLWVTDPAGDKIRMYEL